MFALRGRDKLSDLLTDLESDLAWQREAGDDEAAAATEAEIEDCTRTYREFSRRFNELQSTTLSDSDDTRVPSPEAASWTPGSKRGSRKMAAKIDELEALLKKERAAGDDEAAADCTSSIITRGVSARAAANTGFEARDGRPADHRARGGRRAHQCPAPR